MEPNLGHELGEGLDFALADLGVSSMRIDNPARGFRLNPNRGQTSKKPVPPHGLF